MIIDTHDIGITPYYIMRLTRTMLGEIGRLDRWPGVGQEMQQASSMQDLCDISTRVTNGRLEYLFAEATEKESDRC
jgi:hypothetical protein